MFDGTVDVICGFAFAHHIADLDAFLAETARVLRPGGRAVFVDNAYSPLWQRLKLGVFRPLMRISHEREPRSAGGRARNVGRRLPGGRSRPTHYGGRGPAMVRTTRASPVYVASREREPVPRGTGTSASRRVISSTLMHIDERLARFAPVRHHLIRLIWGFDKP